MPLSSGLATRSMCRSVLVVAMLACLALGTGAHDLGERQLKAEMIVRMLRLVSWRTAPAADATAPLTVLVVGDPALAEALREAAQGQRVDRRPLAIAGVATITQLPAVPPAVVVLAASQRASAPALIRAVEPKGVLTIGDGDGMSQAGLVIGVYVDGDRIRFDANTAAAARAGLSLSSHLLRLARIVG